MLASYVGGRSELIRSWLAAKLLTGGALRIFHYQTFDFCANLHLHPLGFLKFRQKIISRFCYLQASAC